MDTPTTIVAFPKSGITWLRFLLVNIMQTEFNLTSYGLSADLNDFCKSDPRLPNLSWTHDGSSVLNEQGTHHEIHSVFHLRDRHNYSDKRVILLVRDPRDVAVSHFYQVTRRSTRPIHFESVDAFVTDPLYGLDRVIAFMNLWAVERHQPKELLIIHYEELLLITKATLSRVCQFIGLSPSTQTLNNAIKLGDAEKMRDLEKAGKISDFNKFGQDPNSLKVRKAQIGSWRKELLPATIAYCQNRMPTLHPIYGYTPEAIVTWDMAKPLRSHTKLLHQQIDLLKAGIGVHAEKIQRLEAAIKSQAELNAKRQAALIEAANELMAVANHPLSILNRKKLLTTIQSLLKPV